MVFVVAFVECEYEIGGRVGYDPPMSEIFLLVFALERGAAKTTFPFIHIFLSSIKSLHMLLLPNTSPRTQWSFFRLGFYLFQNVQAESYGFVLLYIADVLPAQHSPCIDRCAARRFEWPNQGSVLLLTCSSVDRDVTLIPDRSGRAQTFSLKSLELVDHGFISQRENRDHGRL